MPNFISWSSVPVRASRPCAEQSLECLAALAALHLAELCEALARLLEGDRDERAVLAALGPLELVLDVAQMELLLRHHPLDPLAGRPPIQHAEMGLELVEGEALDGVDGSERDDAAGLGRELLEELPIAPEVLRAVREVRLDLGGHRLRLDAPGGDPVGEHLRVPLLVAMVDLHRAVEISLRLHLAEQALQADDAGVLADAVLLQDERVGLRVAHDFAEAGEVDVDRVLDDPLGFSHLFVLLLFGGPAAALAAPARRARIPSCRSSRPTASGSSSHCRKMPSSAATVMTASRRRCAASGHTLGTPSSYISRMLR